MKFDVHYTEHLNVQGSIPVLTLVNIDLFLEGTPVPMVHGYVFLCSQQQATPKVRKLVDALANQQMTTHRLQTGATRTRPTYGKPISSAAPRTTPPSSRRR
jgi:hypothetical protein